MFSLTQTLNTLEKQEEEGKIDTDFRITNDIHDFSPQVGEIIACDVYGDGKFMDYTLTMVGKETFWATYSINGSDELKLTCRFNTRRSQHSFWRNPFSLLLHYQYTKENI